MMDYQEFLESLTPRGSFQMFNTVIETYFGLNNDAEKKTYIENVFLFAIFAKDRFTAEMYATRFALIANWKKMLNKRITAAREAKDDETLSVADLFDDLYLLQNDKPLNGIKGNSWLDTFEQEKTSDNNREQEKTTENNREQKTTSDNNNAQGKTLSNNRCTPQNNFLPLKEEEIKEEAEIEERKAEIEERNSEKEKEERGKGLEKGNEEKPIQKKNGKRGRPSLLDDFALYYHLSEADKEALKPTWEALSYQKQRNAVFSASAFEWYIQVDGQGRQPMGASFLLNIIRVDDINSPTDERIHYIKRDKKTGKEYILNYGD